MATRTFTFDVNSDYPPVADLVINVGASFTCTYTVNVPAGSAYDMTDQTLSGQMAKYVGAAATATFTVGLTSAYDGQFYIGLTTTQTSALTEGRYFYDVVVINEDKPSADVAGDLHTERLVQGQIIVE